MPLSYEDPDDYDPDIQELRGDRRARRRALSRCLQAESQHDLDDALDELDGLNPQPDGPNDN